jgi:hypothetical protein
LYLDSAYIKNGSITTAHIGNAQIDTAKIKDAAITSAKIDDLAVTSAKINDAAITTAKIGNAAITTAKIGDLAVDTLKIADNAVSVGVGGSGISSLTTVSNGGKIRLDIGLQTAVNKFTDVSSICYIRVFRNGTAIKTYTLYGTYDSKRSGDGFDIYAFNYVCTLPPIIETVTSGTNVTYTLQVALGTEAYKSPGDVYAWIKNSELSMAITELKK